VGGEPLLALMKLAAWSLNDANYATDHDVTVALELARVLCGGAVQANTRVTEQYILDLEREGFLRLSGMAKTQARIEHTLKTGKPLRN
jgi:3-hydroxyacyl-CoA dehydrogenase